MAYVAYVAYVAGVRRMNLLELARSALPGTADQRSGAHYRWRVIGASNGVKEVCCLPEMTAAELQVCYPGARLVPLTDAVTE